MQIAKYQIQEELGHGAMGTVYKAWDPLLDRHVAIKLISGAFQEKLKSLFEREAKSIAKMSDANIITIFDFNYYENQPYIVMELLKGLNLEELARKTDLELLQKLEIVSQICHGLSHAHEQRIIHRDIKPSNIFLTENGVAKIMDFGIARLTTATQTHALLGTPEYMSPEQI
ncbi:MAG TPA: serine/threonine-protein kinase, partial [Acidobacteriota bacterium]|nr:serine/threonine-protein kinase [Acidobacteriota bacterium]